MCTVLHSSNLAGVKSEHVQKPYDQGHLERGQAQNCVLICSLFWMILAFVLFVRPGEVADAVFLLLLV